MSRPSDTRGFRIDFIPAFPRMPYNSSRPLHATSAWRSRSPLVLSAGSSDSRKDRLRNTSGGLWPILPHPLACIENPCCPQLYLLEEIRHRSQPLGGQSCKPRKVCRSGISPYREVREHPPL